MTSAGRGLPLPASALVNRLQTLGQGDTAASLPPDFSFADLGRDSDGLRRRHQLAVARARLGHGQGLQLCLGVREA